jgi:hypothetical protein
MSHAFKIIPRFDPAIDAMAMGPEDVAAYRDTGDVALVKLRDGETPTVYHCRGLRVSEMQSARASTVEADVYTAAFARGVMRVEGLRSDDGSRRVWVRPDADRPVSAREIDQVFSAGDVFEVGAAIYGRSILGKGRPAAWPQPATSRLAVEALVRQLAAQTREQDAPSAPSKSGAEAPPQETSTD